MDGQPIRFDGRKPALRMPPEIGEHNEYVMRELLGLLEDDYVSLLVEGVLR